jgi:aspartate/methionine/tyrosine aminotransferase
MPLTEFLNHIRSTPCKVMVLPAHAFMDTAVGWFRICFTAQTEADVMDGLKRFADTIDSL